METEITNVGILFADANPLTQEQVHTIVSRYSRHIDTSCWVIGDAILRDPRMPKNSNAIPTYILKEYSVIIGRGIQYLRTIVRTSQTWPISRRDKNIPAYAYQYLTTKINKFGKKFVEETLNKYKTDAWTGTDLRSYIHRYELEVKLSRFAKDTSPEAAGMPETQTSKDESSYTSDRYLVVTDCSEYYIRDTEGLKEILAHFPFSPSSIEKKNLAKKMAFNCRDFLVSLNK